MEKLIVLLVLLTVPDLSFSQIISVDTLFGEQTSIEFNTEIGRVEIEKLPLHNRSRVFEYLRGLVSGLEINSSSGGPGSSISGVLRGYNSVLNDNIPLIVLDGMIINNDEFNTSLAGVDQTNRLIDINSQDIASVNVLKGIIGASKYGIRGSNGVIELTSKNGKSDKLQIDFSTALSFSKVNKLVDLQNTYAQGRLEMYRGPEFQEGFSWGPAIADLEFDGDTNYPFDKMGRLVPKGFGNGIPAQAYDPYDFLQSAISQDHNIAFSKGSEKFGLRISGGMNKTNGVIPKTYFNRYSASALFNFKPLSKLHVNAGLRYVSSDAYKNFKGSSVSGVMVGLTRTSPSFDNTNGLTSSEAFDNESAYILPDGNQRSYRNGIYDNPYWSINKNPNNNNSNRIIGNLSATYSILENIDLTYSYGIDGYTEIQDGGVAINGFRDGYAYENKKDFNSNYHKLFTGLEFKLSNKISMNGEVGFDFFKSYSKNEMISGFILQEGLPVDISSATDIELNNSDFSKATLGVYLLSKFSFENWANATLTLRNDKSSALGENSDNLISYSLDVDADIVRIGESKDTEFDTDDKLILSAGYGRSGNDIRGSINRRSYNPLFIGGDGFIDQTSINDIKEISGFAVNKNLRPEITNAVQIGVKYISFENRIGFGLRVYYEKTDDVINYVDLESSTGFDQILLNDISMSNKGFEFDLWGKILERENLAWTFSANVSKNTNEVLSSLTEINNQLGGFTSVNSNVVVGEPYGVILGSTFLRDSDNRIVIGADGFPLFGSNREPVGNPIPDLLANINNEVRIGKRITLNGLIDIRSGGDIWCGTCGVLDYFGRTELSAQERNQTRVFEGVGSSGQENTIEVKLANPEGDLNSYYRVRYGFGGLTEMNIYDVSWIRLRRLGLNFEILPKGMKFIQKLNVGVFGHNLFLISDYPGIDPETNVSGTGNGRGIDYFNNPNTKAYGISLNATF